MSMSIWILTIPRRARPDPRLRNNGMTLNLPPWEDRKSNIFLFIFINFIALYFATQIFWICQKRSVITGTQTFLLIIITYFSELCEYLYLNKAKEKSQCDRVRETFRFQIAMCLLVKQSKNLTYQVPFYWYYLIKTHSSIMNSFMVILLQKNRKRKKEKRFSSKVLREILN